MAMIEPKAGPVRVACYSRVSTREQVEGLSLDVQKESMERFIGCQPGWVLFRHYCDAGISGTTTDRPAFQRMLKDAEAHLFDVVLVHKLDRVSRTLYNLMTLVFEELEPLGVGFRSVSEAMVDTSTPVGRLMMQHLGSMAEFEVNRIRERTREGKEKAAELGHFNGGTRPYGYQVENKKLVVIPEEAAVVRWCFEEYAKGKRGARSLCTELNRKGIPTRQGARWSPGTVSYLLSNTVYIGSVTYRKRPGWKKGRRRTVNRQETWLVSEDSHEPIVSRELWDEVQAMLAKRKTNGNPNRVFHDQYLLSGILYCERCGRAMWGRSTKNGSYKRLNYCCPTYQVEGKDACPQCNVACEVIDRQLIDFLKTMVERIPGFVERLEEDVRRASTERDPELAQKISALRDREADLERQLSKARELCLKELISDAAYEAESIRIKDEKEALTEERLRLEEQAVVQEWRFLKARTIAGWLKDLDAAMAASTPAERREFIQSVFERVSIQGNQVARFRLNRLFMRPWMEWEGIAI